MYAFAEVGKCNDVAGVLCLPVFVGHPQFDAVDGDTAENVRQCGHPSVVVVAEIVCEEEVSVLTVVAGTELERGGLHAVFRLDGLRCRLFLRHHGLYGELSELQVGA